MYAVSDPVPVNACEVGMGFEVILLSVNEKLPLPSVCNICPTVPSLIPRSNKSLISLAIVMP